MSLPAPARRVAAVCVALAAASLIANIALPPEMAGRWEVYSFLRKSVSRFLSAGTLWAAVAVYAGWQSRRPLTAIVAGVAASEATLLLHYLLGMLAGLYGVGELATNVSWFLAGVVLCGPLGLVGWLAARRGWIGLAARLLVPVAAVAEPWVLGLFVPYPELPWSVRASSILCGVLLTVAGVVAGLWVLAKGLAGFRLPGDEEGPEGRGRVRVEVL